MRPAKFGINIPQFHPDGTRLAPLGEFARAAESLGFDSLWTLDGIFHAIPFLESLSSLAYVAGLTASVKLGTAVLLLPLRPPAALAAATATIDHLSSGRLILGVGLGGSNADFQASAVPIRERLPRFLESVQVMKLLWTRESVSYQGRFWRLENATISPRPARPGGIPIWFGGSQLGNEVNERAILRAARLGDGWLGAGSTSLAAHEGAVSKFFDFAKAQGRDPELLSVAKRVYVHVDPDAQRARSVLDEMLLSFYGRRLNVDETCVYGSESTCVKKLARLVETGTGVLILNPVEDYVRQAELLAKNVIPSL